MKREKDRLHKTLVIGATPAGIAATSKLGEIGIPVILIDSCEDLDQKLASEEWRLNSGTPFNFAHRPSLIRILRNPAIDCILPAQIESIKHSSQGFRVKIRKQAVYVDSKSCTLCGRCLEICPASNSPGQKAVHLNSRLQLPGRAVIDKRQEPPCQTGCPLGVNAQGYITLSKAGRYAEALDLIRKDNVLPGICGRICTHPCEAECRRKDLDEAVAIRDIKRFIADYELSRPEGKISIEPELKDKPERSEKIAIIGSGPAGLAAAADLARLGYSVTVFEKEAHPGGLLRYAVGSHRLPRNILDHEIKYIESLGVNFIVNHPVNLTNDLSPMMKKFDGVLLATGSWADRKLQVPGEDLNGVEGCLSFLNRIYREDITSLKEKTAVIGDGNAAFDLARTLKRMGSDVTLISWFPKDLIPADPEEIKAAEEENIPLLSSRRVSEFIGEKGRLENLVLLPTKPGPAGEDGIPWPVTVKGGKPEVVKFDRAFVSIGQTGHLTGGQLKPGFTVSDNGLVVADDKAQTAVHGLYAAGDGTTGPTSVVKAMADGRKAARNIHLSLSGESIPDIRTARPSNKNYPDIPGDIPSMTRPFMSENQPSKRRGNFEEVTLGLSESQVTFETGRCLQCGVCSQCMECVDVCEAIKAIRHDDTDQILTEHAGVIIIADPDMAPSIQGDDVIRAYGPKMAKTDINAMILRGHDAAAKAMVLLGGTSQRPKGRGISFHTPDPGLSDIVRVGIFVCRCNDSLGWMEEMTEHLQTLALQEDIVHVEALSSACIENQSARLVRTIREKGITRVVLASCVCCPLNFVCSACSDQRSRLKSALFTATGISRSMVETCNLRGEVLRHVRKNPETALAGFKGLMDRSITRAKMLKPLPSLVRNYNFATAVIGDSEASVAGAITLAEAGLEVFLFRSGETPFPNLRDYPTITLFRRSVVNSISGTLGDFHLKVQSDDFEQTVQVGSVILGEKSRTRTPYIHQENLPSRMVASTTQSEGVTGLPFFAPGATSIKGLYLADPTGISVSKRIKGTAAAMAVAAIMPRSPRQNKGFTVVIDQEICRGCGRCINICAYQAVTLHRNNADGWHARVDEAVCKGCGSCTSVCPSNAADSPYRDQLFLERTLKEVLAV
ncbi:MAG: 4Fe-4S dicluster domain-containing protein [Desulfobacteraceae bacterium]|nr:4Fe-4S dicluster domain-containing protein [Desulfobacteraceae bacterium]MBU4055189.1 FAD-dependent oxidoreductase [Pseudomonadota bacterium]